MREIIASLDIGSSKIKLVVAELKEDGFNVLCAIDETSRGVKNGVIVEVDDTVYAIKKLLKKEEELLGLRISKVIVSVNEEGCMFKIGESSISITSENKEIDSSDIVRALQMSVKGNVKKEYDLITVIPIMFKVDDRKTRAPKGQKGNSLSVKSVVVTSPKEDIYRVAKCLEKCGLEITDIMISSIGSYYAHKTESTDTQTGVVIDCGAETIKVSVFNKGIIINNIVLKIGGVNVDNDIKYIYKISDEQAKKIKEKLALANKKYASTKESEVVVNSNGEKIKITQTDVTEIVMSRLHELLNMSKNEINYLTKKEISYIIITGGLTEFKDFPLEVESVFGKNAYVGKIPIIGVRDNKYASCVGMIKYFDSKLRMRDKKYTIFNSDELDILSATGDKKVSGDSILGKVFGLFFDN